MKRLPITAEERLFFKSIEKTAMVLLLMFKIYPVPLNADTLAYEMKMDSRTAKKHLDELASDHLTLLMKGQGYVLTGSTRSLVAEFFGVLISTQFEAQALAQGSQAQAQQVLEVNETTHTVCALVEGGESLTPESSFNSPLPTESAQNARVDLPPTELIIAETSVLFGEPGVVRGQLDLDVIEPLYALAVLAHCYSMRKTDSNPGGLFLPAGLAYKMLLEGRKPRPQFIADPLKHLSSEYLDALGLYIAEPEMPAVELESIDVEPAEVFLPLADDHKGAIAWEAAKEQLSKEIRRASFDNWVSGTKAVAFDGQLLTVGAHNAYARDWLEGRLESTVTQMLIGILNNAQVKVRFVVADLGEVESDD